MKWYWHSFSLDGVNQGICIVFAETEDLALQRTIDLDIHPKHDSLEVYATDSISNIEAEGLDLNRLYGKEELVAMGYQTVDTFGISENTEPDAEKD